MDAFAIFLVLFIILLLAEDVKEKTADIAVTEDAVLAGEGSESNLPVASLGTKPKEAGHKGAKTGPLKRRKAHRGK